MNKQLIYNNYYFNVDDFFLGDIYFKQCIRAVHATVALTPLMCLQRKIQRKDLEIFPHKAKVKHGNAIHIPKFNGYLKNKQNWDY